MSENGEIYTAGKNFTLPPALTGWTNSTSAIIIKGDTKGGNRRVVGFPALTKNMLYDHDDNRNGDDHHNHHRQRHKGQLLEGRWAPVNGSAPTKGDICLPERKSTRIRRMAF